ncbi:MAG: aminotransferase class III-fold pyridoxal phosphate-dependent enzyme, partial [Gammaproteobacteria bacterium]|nr:aminotransferase class III-fold pyridoxal phosphate-dependent enzyme [Gammaproteobacteria bacterium]
PSQFITAVWLEPIQGEGGINLLQMDFLRQLRQLCDKNDWLLMVDEVQCGMGRTGKWLAHQWADIRPDVVSMAKGLASGLPIGAVIAGPVAKDIFQPGNHGCTFGGSPLVTRVAAETLAVVQVEGLLNNALEVGSYLKSQLIHNLKHLPQIVDIRGQGLMLGIELSRPCRHIMQLALEEGLLLSVTAEKVVRLLPPLILTQGQADEIVEKLCKVIEKFINGIDI